MTTHAIEIRGLEKKYRTGFWKAHEKYGLRGISLNVERGEIFGCLGPNGAGKTTTLKLLTGLMFPSAGSATVLGLPLGDPRLRSQIGFLPEQPYFYDYLTAQELLEYYAQLSGIDARDRRRRAELMLERVGLASSARVQLRKFSKGMLQRLGIAQAVLHDPTLLFLDEPMSGLDPVGRREVRDLIQDLRDDGKTIFFSTHILSDAESLCDRVAVLHQGEIRGTAVVSELLAKARGNFELVWEGAPAALELKTILKISTRSAGEVFRATIGESDLYRALNAVRQAQGRIVAVNPLHGSVEDFFLAHVAETPLKTGQQE